jgi:hypothetical protein
MRSYGAGNGYRSHCRGQFAKLSSSRSNAQLLKRCVPIAGRELSLEALLSADSMPRDVKKSADVACR